MKVDEIVEDVRTYVLNVVVLFYVSDPRKSSFCQDQKLLGILNEHKHHLES